MQIRFINTKFSLVLTHMKVGTQYLGRFKELEQKRSGNISNAVLMGDIRVNLEFKDNKWIRADDDLSNPNLKSEYEVLDSFLNGTIIKDVIILIRNPYERFISAFNQDNIKGLFTKHNKFHVWFFVLSILKNIDSSDADILWWYTNKELISDINLDVDESKLKTKFKHSPQDFEIFLSIFQKILEEVITMWDKSNESIFSLHNQIHHQNIILLLSNNKNLNKVKIVDIDETNLDDVFSKYLVGVGEKLGKKNVGGFTKDIIKRIFLEREKRQTGRDIVKLLELEILSYDLLRIMKNNLDNSN